MVDTMLWWVKPLLESPASHVRVLTQVLAAQLPVPFSATVSGKTVASGVNTWASDTCMGDLAL